MHVSLQKIDVLIHSCSATQLEQVLPKLTSKHLVSICNNVVGLTCSLAGLHEYLSHLLAGVTGFKCREMGVFG